MVNIYMLNKDGTPMMPVHSFGRARRMVKSGKARIVRTKPFTLQMNEEVKDPEVDRCLLGIDPGRTNIGLCAVDDRGRVLFCSDVITRNRYIAGLLLKKKQARQASRRGERRVRQRRAAACDKNGLARHTEFWRMLPGCKKPVCCKTIRNTKAKFEHRVRPDGWLTPTAEHLLRTHMNAVKKVMSFLPVSEAVIELNRFDFARMENPGIRNWEYQRGRLAGYDSVEEAVFIQQKGKCLLCGKRKIEYCHHIIPKSKGGSDTIGNRAGLCRECHYGDKGVHKDEGAAKRLIKRKKGLRRKYHALSVINQIMPYLLEQLMEILPISVTTGRETHAIRKTCSLPVKEKDDGTHYIDAWCIAVSVLDRYEEDPDFEGSFYTIQQFRRHDRARVKAQKERTYYLDGKAIAHNRHKRTGQSDTGKKWDSLSEFGAKRPKDVSRLTVRKSTRSYNDMHRPLPGAEVEYEGRRYILSGKHNDRYMLMGVGGSGVPISRCRLVKRNTGLVFL